MKRINISHKLCTKLDAMDCGTIWEILKEVVKEDFTMEKDGKK